MPAGGPAVAHDRAAIAAVYAAIIAAVSMLIAFPHYAPSLPSLWHALEPFGNGLAGGAVAGSVAIAVFRIGRRSESREKKLVAAKALAAELNQTHRIVKFDWGDSSPFSSDDETDQVPDAVRLASSAKSAAGHSHHEAAEGGQVPRPLPNIPRRVYEGLVSSGGILHFEPNLQLRLNAFYEYVERGDREAVTQLIWPLVRDVGQFRDANSPFAWSDLAWPPRRAASGLRGWYRRRRKRAPGGAGSRDDDRGAAG